MTELTGLRVLVETDGDPVYGVARVRYNEGHSHAGMYEVERADGTSFLALWGECGPGPSLPSNFKWDAIPEDVRFCGSQFFEPSFLDGTGRRFLTASPGVVVPGDMEALRALVSRVEPGFEVDWMGHGSNTFRGLVTVSTVDDKGVGVKAPAGAPTYCTWPAAGIEMGPQYGNEFWVEGDTLHFVHVPPRRTGKMPSPALSLTFKRPRAFPYR